MYIKINSDNTIHTYPYNLYQLREDNPRTAFSAQPTVDELAPFGVAPVEPTPMPAHETVTQRVDEGTPVLEGGNWRQKWVVVDLPTQEAQANLQAAKSRMRDEINAERDRREAGGFDYLGKRLDSDERSVLRFNIAVQAAQAAVAAGQPFSIDWTCADNSVLALDAVGMLGIPVTFAIYGNALHQHARTLKAEVDAATTPVDLAAINVTAGWPE